jgi:hypothetical protein
MATHLFADSSSTICNITLKLKIEPLVVSGARDAAALIQGLSRFSLVVVPALLVEDTYNGGYESVWILSDVPLLVVLSMAVPAGNLQPIVAVGEGSRVDDAAVSTKGVHGDNDMEQANIKHYSGTMTQNVLIQLGVCYAIAVIYTRCYGSR